MLPPKELNLLELLGEENHDGETVQDKIMSVSLINQYFFFNATQTWSSYETIIVHDGPKPGSKNKSFCSFACSSHLF